MKIFLMKYYFLIAGYDQSRGTLSSRIIFVQSVGHLQVIYLLYDFMGYYVLLFIYLFDFSII